MQPTYSDPNALVPEPAVPALAEPAAAPPRPYPTYLESWAALGWLVLAIIVASVAAAVLLVWLPKEQLTGWGLLLGQLMQLGLVFWLLRRAGSRAQAVRWRGPFDGPALWAVVVPTTLGVALGIATLQWLQLPHWGVDKAFNQLMLHPALSFGLICVGAPILEEWLMRGVLLAGLARNYGPGRAILQTSLLFGLMHFNPAQSLAAFCLGLFLGWLYVRTESVRACVLAHATVNTTSWSFMYFGQEKYGELETWSTTSAADLAAIGGGVLVAAAGIWALARLTSPRPPQPEDAGAGQAGD